MIRQRRFLPRLWTVILLSIISAKAGAQTSYNYGEVLQMSQYFYQAQESGTLSPGNRVSWRGAAHLQDGQDAGRDLSGGWYDAGDHWKSNTTMAYAASLLAWSAVQYPAAYTQTSQTDELLNNLKHVNDYFLKCIVDPNPATLTDFTGYEVFIDIAGQPGVAPDVHSVWCAPEVTNGNTVRQALKVNTTVRGPDVAGAMAAAMASSAILFYQNGNQAYAQTLLSRARKLTAYASQFRFVTDGYQGAYEPRRDALAPDGSIKQIGYRSWQEEDEIMFANGWLHRAMLVIQPSGYTGSYLQAMRTECHNMLAADQYAFGSWLDLFISQYNHAALMLYLQLDPTDPEGIEDDLRHSLETWTDYADVSPYGLHTRSVYGGNFSLKWSVGETYLAMMYSDWTTNNTYKTKFYNFAKSQIDYALGNNKQQKSFVIGFGSKGWFNTPHHRGAHGAYRGFDNYNSESYYYLPEARHVLYGALMGGPDGNDNFTPRIDDHLKNEVALDFNAGLQGTVAALVARNPSAYPPIADAQFPAVDTRNTTLDPLTTDREYFVVARQTASSANSITLETELWNKSRWIPKVLNQMSYRYFITLDNGATASSISATVSGTGATASVQPYSGNICYIEVKFPGLDILPNVNALSTSSRSATVTITADAAAHWNVANDFSYTGLDNTLVIRPKIAVYNNGTFLEGELPGGVSNISPTVSVTSPTNQTTYSPGSNIVITATAADTDGSIAKVEFYNGASKLGEALTTPYSYTWTNVAAGTYTLTAKATDNQGATTTSTISISVQTAGSVPSPLVALAFNENIGTAVGNTGTLGGTFSRTTPTPAWTTNAAGGSSAIDFGTATGSYAVESNLALDGLKNLSAFTITGWVNSRSNTVGAGGNRIVSWINNGGDGVDLVYNTNGSLQISVDQWPDNLPTSSSANKVTTNASASASNWVFFAATYSSTDGQVKFYFGNAATDAALDVTRTYNQGAVNTNIGKLSIGHFNDATRANAPDRMFRGLIDEIRIYGQALTPAQVIAVQRSAAPNVAPTVTLTSPVANSSHAAGSSITLTATAADTDGTVAKVEFFRGTTKVGEDTSTPYSIVWTNAAAGNYSLTAIATDNAGATTTSAAVAITVNAFPTPLVKLGFNENTGTNLSNSGSLAATFTRSTPTPAWTTTAVAGASAVDFGTTSGSYVVESSAVLDGLKGLSAFTITGWLNNRSNVVGAGGNRVVSWINNGGDGVDLVYNADGSLQLSVDEWPDYRPTSSSTGKVTTSATAPASNWVFFAATYDAAAGTLKFYFGNSAASAVLDVTRTYNQGPVNTNIGKLAIGHFNDATRANATDRMFRGLIDELYIFGQALTLNEIVAVQNASTTTAPAQARVSYGAENPAVSESPVTLYPNPANHSTTLDFYAERDGYAAVELINGLGKAVVKQEHRVVKGKNSITIDLADVQQGLYMVVLGQGRNKISRKLIIRP